MSGEHVNINDPNIHEPKGITTATAGQVYVADGLNSGSWQMVDYSLTITITDADAAASFWIVVPNACNFVKAYAVVNDAFDTDQDIDFEIGGVPVVDGTISMLSGGSAAGDIFNCTPSADNTLGAGDSLEIVNAGGSGSTFTVQLTLVFTQTGL